MESGAYRYPLSLLRDEERFSSVTVSASVILGLSSDGIRSGNLGGTLCTVFMELFMYDTYAGRRGSR